MHASYINPYVRLATASVIPSGHHILRRILYDYELIYLERGAFTFFFEDRPYHCKQGDILFIRPGVPHSFRIDCGEISQPHIHFDITHRPQSETIPVSFKDLHHMTPTEKSWIHKDYFSHSPSASPLISISNRAEFLDLFYRMLSKDADPLCKKAWMIQLIAAIIRAYDSEVLADSGSANIACQIKDYLDAGNGLEMNLEDFAKQFNYNKYYLEKKFKQTYQISLIKYRDQRRMDSANALLRQYSVTQVAQELGYQSIYSFSRAYKKHFGVSPRRHAMLAQPTDPK